MSTLGNIFITGIAGSVGTQIAMLAAKQGWRVSGLALPSEDVVLLERSGAQIHRGRIEDKALLEQITEGSTHGVHCAALLPNSDHLGRNAFWQINVEGARTMCALAVKQGWRRIVFLSTVGVLDRNADGGPSTDETRYRQPFDNYTWSKIEAEKVILGESERLQLPSVILRPANVYGPNMSFKWPDVFNLIQSGRMRLIGDGSVPFGLIHVSDLARAVIASLEDDLQLAPGERITIVSPEVLTLREVLAVIANKLDAPPVRSLPYGLVLAAAYLISPLPDWLRFGPLKYLKPMQVRELHQGFLFDPIRAKSRLRFEAQILFYGGIDEALAQWRTKQP